MLRRAVNQVLGKVICHKQDWGAVLLLDERYLQPSVQRRLSKWWALDPYIARTCSAELRGACPASRVMIVNGRT